MGLYDIDVKRSVYYEETFEPYDSIAQMFRI